MALDRTWLTSLVDDAGTGTTGTPWNKAAVTHIYDDADAAFASELAACLLSMASFPTIPSGGSPTILNFDTETSDPLNMHTGVNPSRITIPSGKAGLYLVSFAFTFNDSTSGARAGAINKGGVQQGVVWVTPPAPANVVSCALAIPVVCAVGDYLEVTAYQSSGAGVALTTARFSAVRLG